MCFLAYFIDPSFLLQLLFGLVALDRPAVTLIKLFSCFDQQVVIPFFRLLFILLAQLLNFGHQLNKRLPYHLARCVVAPAWTEQILVFLKRDPALVKSIWGEGGPLYLESRVTGSSDFIVPVHHNLWVSIVIWTVILIKLVRCHLFSGLG